MGNNLVRQGVRGVVDEFNRFEDLFKGFLLRHGDQLSFYRDIKLDVRENDTSYIMHVDLPGVKKEDITIHVDGNVVTFQAEWKSETEEKEGEKLLHHERRMGNVSRSFQLPLEVIDDQCVAKFNDGVLELVLPKRNPPDTRRKLEIS